MQGEEALLEKYREGTLSIEEAKKLREILRQKREIAQRENNILGVVATVLMEMGVNIYIDLEQAKEEEKRKGKEGLRPEKSHA